MDSSKVVIKGKGMYGDVSHIFLVAASYFTVDSISMGEVSNHIIQVQGEKGASYFSALNSVFYDSYEQLLKISGKGENGLYSQNGIVNSCLFEYTEGIGPQYYIGGVDAHAAYDWIVSNNVFKNIVSPESQLAEHAIHFWSGSKDTLVENNLILNCDRGIGFGLGSSTHIGGTIRRNKVHTTRDVGIGLENASHVLIEENLVFTENYPYSIEYRFSGTSGTINGNITNGEILKRNDGSANVFGNLTEKIPFDNSLEEISMQENEVLVSKPSNWAVEEINELKSTTKIKTELYSDYQLNISRKDFAYLSVLLYEGLSEMSSWALSSIRLAFKHGIMNGIGDNTILPKEYTTKEQSLVLIYNILNQKEEFDLME